MDLSGAAIKAFELADEITSMNEFTCIKTRRAQPFVPSLSSTSSPALAPWGSSAVAARRNARLRPACGERNR